MRTHEHHRLVCNLQRHRVAAIAAYGVLRLPDALARQHAATKAATLALTVMILGLALLQPTLEWLVRLAALAVVLMLTVPFASHALARAAAGKAEHSSRKDPNRLNDKAPAP